MAQADFGRLKAAEAPTLAEPLHRETPDVPVAGNHDPLELGRARKMQVVLSSLGELLHGLKTSRPRRMSASTKGP